MKTFLIGILAILGGWWPMADQYFKRSLRVPHYDAAGEEVIVEGEYIKEWMVRNRVINPSFELSDGGDPDLVLNWTGGVNDELRKVDTNPRSGTYCCSFYYNSNNVGREIFSDHFPIPATSFQFGFGAEVYIRRNTNVGSFSGWINIQFGTVSGGVFTAVESFEGDAAISAVALGTDSEWVKSSLTVLPGQVTQQYSYARLKVKLYQTHASETNNLIDDAAFYMFNPHYIINYDDFAALNVEDYETFHFGDDYDLADSGGQPLVESSPYSADDPVALLTMRDGDLETALSRPARDTIALVFRLFSRAQVLKLRQWYKHTRGLPFTWVDDRGVETEVIWTGAFNPVSEGTHDTWTVQINLQPVTVDAGGI